MNKIYMTGRLTKDIFLDQSKQGSKFCKFSVAVRRGKDETDFFNCTAFNKRAETIAQYCKKGDMVGIAGVMQSNRREKITYWEVIVDDIEFLNTKNNTESDTTTAQAYKKVDDDEDLPF